MLRCQFVVCVFTALRLPAEFCSSFEFTRLILSPHSNACHAKNKFILVLLRFVLKFTRLDFSANQYEPEIEEEEPFSVDEWQEACWLLIDSYFAEKGIMCQDCVDGDW